MGLVVPLDKVEFSSAQQSVCEPFVPVRHSYFKSTNKRHFHECNLYEGTMFQGFAISQHMHVEAD